MANFLMHYNFVENGTSAIGVRPCIAANAQAAISLTRFCLGHPEAYVAAYEVGSLPATATVCDMDGSELREITLVEPMQLSREDECFFALVGS